MSANETIALKMWRGREDKAVTHYSCGLVERAKKDGVGVQIVGPRGKFVVVPAKRLRIHHRPNFTGTFSAVHDRAGEGKYIDDSAWRGGKTVVGAQHVVPYLAHEGCYASIVQAFLKEIGLTTLKGLKAHAKRTHDDGDYLEWQGKRTPDNCVAASPWLTKDEVWSKASALNVSLPRQLKAAESKRKGIKTHQPPKRKFLDNINVMRRTRRFYNPFTGETTFKGGKDPYGVPLEQAGYAIDFCFLTDGYVVQTDAKGRKVVVETGNYYLRLVIGRSVPWVMTQKNWAGCEDSDRHAFKSEQIRQSIIEARKRLDKTSKVA